MNTNKSARTFHNWRAGRRFCFATYVLSFRKVPNFGIFYGLSNTPEMLFRHVKPKDLHTLLMIAIWKDNIDKVEAMVKPDETIINRFHEFFCYTPFHFALHLKRTEIAETLFRDYNGDMTRNYYCREEKPIHCVKAAETAFDQQLDYFFDKYPNKLTEKTQEILSKRKDQNPCKIFFCCLTRFEIEAAMYHLNRANRDSINRFFSENGNIRANRYRIFLSHKNYGNLVLFITKCLNYLTVKLSDELLLYLLELSSGFINENAINFLMSKICDRSNQITLYWSVILTENLIRFADKVFHAISFDDLDLFVYHYERFLKKSEESHPLEKNDYYSILTSSIVHNAEKITKFLLRYVIDNDILDSNSIVQSLVVTAMTSQRFGIVQFLVAYIDEQDENGKEILDAFSEAFSYKDLRK